MPCCIAEAISCCFKDVNVLMLTALSNPGQMVINFSVVGAECSNCVISIFFSTAHFICKLRLNTWRKKAAGKGNFNMFSLQSSYKRANSSDLRSGAACWGQLSPLADLRNPVFKEMLFWSAQRHLEILLTQQLACQEQQGLQSLRTNKGRRTAPLPA